ncbi:D-lactaldehyde dehydrogenase [Artomyces pyxidatus]|uniref:D-lactaldehyde dehydrogenase n=1 Tax=Artomyces pyxidatus TaxID=48021 RepID=A0ACB8T4G0_9AGAM|nr:D-lactaldehyde dehydrogenase [Artomyces pyxidatus]
MSPVTAPAKVLVTGANGFIAAWVVRTLLESGYTVRGTVRSASKGEHLKALFASFQERFEVVTVDDITKDGAFDEAVKDIDLVEHTASPFHFNAKEPDELIVPAVRGTVGILESVKRYGTSVKRVVITSSTAAITVPSSEPVSYNEFTWNDPAVQKTKELGAAAGPAAIYQASKTLAEKAAWDFVEENKASIGWDLVTLNPPYVYGPPINEVTSLKELNTSMDNFYKAVVDGSQDAAKLASNSASWIDVRDIAKGHVLAGEKGEAGGQRIIVSAGEYYWQDIVDVANSIDPAPLPNLVRGNPGATKGKQFLIRHDASKLDRVLGLKPRSLEDTVRDSLIMFAGFQGKN